MIAWCVAAVIFFGPIGVLFMLLKDCEHEPESPFDVGSLPIHDEFMAHCDRCGDDCERTYYWRESRQNVCEGCFGSLESTLDPVAL